MRRHWASRCAIRCSFRRRQVRSLAAHEETWQSQALKFAWPCANDARVRMPAIAWITPTPSMATVGASCSRMNGISTRPRGEGLALHRGIAAQPVGRGSRRRDATPRFGAHTIGGKAPGRCCARCGRRSPIDHTLWLEGVRSVHSGALGSAHRCLRQSGRPFLRKCAALPRCRSLSSSQPLAFRTSRRRRGAA